jgi:hypothetical protein
VAAGRRSAAAACGAPGASGGEEGRHVCWNQCQVRIVAKSTMDIVICNLCNPAMLLELNQEMLCLLESNSKLPLIAPVSPSYHHVCTNVGDDHITNIIPLTQQCHVSFSFVF